MNTYYPSFINLKGKECIVIGGGNVAERKVLSLLNSGAIVKVISPEITDTLKKYVEEGQIQYLKRKYRKGDIKDAFMVIVATSDAKINKKIADEATCLINVVDNPEMSNFIVPSVLKRGLLTIAISTSGASPAMAKYIRMELQNLYGKDFAKFLSFLKQIRSEVLRKISDKRKREILLKTLVGKNIIRILREKGFKAAKNKVIDEVKANL
jgi:precorrin-2 dehydrogenase/sirohydrochlorin ferrochelatase